MSELAAPAQRLSSVQFDGLAEEAMAQELADLADYCEQGFAAVHQGYVKATTIYPPEEGGMVYRFDTLVNGRVKEEGARTETAPSILEAVRQFRDGWAKYRAEHPGDVLLWRARPELAEWRSSFAASWEKGWSGLPEEGWYIRARVAIVLKAVGVVAAR